MLVVLVVGEDLQCLCDALQESKPTAYRARFALLTIESEQKQTNMSLKAHRIYIFIEMTLNTLRKKDEIQPLYDTINIIS